jgi:hypothetical protein
MGAERQVDDDPGDHPPVAPADLGRSLRRPVVSPERVVHPPAPAAEQGVIDDDRDRLVVGEQPGHDQPRQRQAEPVSVPDRGGEEPARGVERHHRAHPGAGEHAHHRPARGARHQASGQDREEPVRRGAGEDRTQRLQQQLPGRR